MNEKQVKAFENGKTVALWMGGAVYAGVVLLFLAFFQNLMAEQFTGFLQVVARLGAVLVALNALALPVALHYWTVTGWHKGTGIAFYALDVILMGLNTIAAANLHNSNIPDWVEGYTAFAPGSVIFTLFGWAVLFMTDPGQRALVKLSEALTNAQVVIVQRAAEYVGSDDGIENVVVPFAGKLAAKVFNERRLIGSSRALPVTPNGEDGDIIAEIVKQVTARMAANGVTTLPEVTPSLPDGVTADLEVTPQVTPLTESGVGQSKSPFRGNGRKK